MVPARRLLLARGNMIQRSVLRKGDSWLSEDDLTAGQTMRSPHQSAEGPEWRQPASLVARGLGQGPCAKCLYLDL